MTFIRLDNPLWEAAARALLRMELEGECWRWPGSLRRVA